jgi:hypothetical protein
MLYRVDEVLRTREYFKILSVVLDKKIGIFSQRSVKTTDDQLNLIDGSILVQPGY